MARKVSPLSDTSCKSAKPREKDYKLADGKGLFLLIKVSGTKVWRFKYVRPDGREALATFGEYPALSLADARTKRDEYRELLAKDIDPMPHTKEQRQAQTLAASNTFELIARDWHKAKAVNWNPDHAEKVWRRITLYLLPTLGQRPVTTLKPRDMLRPLKAVEADGKLEVAQRLRQYTNGVMNYAVQHGYIESNPARDLVGATASKKAEHRPALPLNRLPELLERMDRYSGHAVVRLAARLTLSTFVRSSELRFARWPEFDLDRGMWTIPGKRTPIEGVRYSTRGAKMKKPHLVPLSRQAVAILKQLHEINGAQELVFASPHKGSRVISENTLSKALRGMGYSKDEVCGHGFRTMACSALTESGLWSKDAVERQMSHQERNGVRAAYIHKAEHLEQRRLMCQWWDDYLDANRTDHVTPYEYARRGQDDPHVVPIRRHV